MCAVNYACITKRQSQAKPSQQHIAAKSQEMGEKRPLRLWNFKTDF